MEENKQQEEIINEEVNKVIDEVNEDEIQFKLVLDRQSWEYHTSVRASILTPEFNLVGSFLLTMRDGYMMELSSVYVQPKFRNQGYAHLIMQTVFQLAVQFQQSEMFLQIHKDSTIGSFYEKYGFVLDEVQEGDDENYKYMTLKKN